MIDTTAGSTVGAGLGVWDAEDLVDVCVVAGAVVCELPDPPPEPEPPAAEEAVPAPLCPAPPSSVPEGPADVADEVTPWAPEPEDGE